MNKCESCVFHPVAWQEVSRCGMGVACERTEGGELRCPLPGFECPMWKKRLPEPVEFIGTVGKAEIYKGQELVVCPFLGEDGLVDTVGGRVEVTLKYLEVGDLE